MADLFADSYAFLAAMDRSAAYQKLLRDNGVVTTALNAMEVAQAVLRRGEGAKLAGLLRPILALCVQPAPSMPEAAARFRQERREAGANCSSIDAWGYATARSLGLPFLTGDEGFRGVPGVKFVKA